jgi:3-hydroxyisobutyrate dehydrogenase
MTDIKRIGFVGIGNMGTPMAANLVRAGYDVMAFDADSGRATAFAAEHGARSASDPEELGRHSDALVTMLPTGREVRDVLFGMQGGVLSKNLQKGAVIVDMSSADPVGTRAIGRDLAALRIDFVDAPVSGGVVRAKDGSLAIMIGGDSAVVSRIKPVLSCMGGKLFEVGSLGCGHAMKALNNFLAATSFAAAAEAVAVGRTFGLDPAVMTDVLNVSTGRSFATENLIKQHVLSGSFSTGFALGLLAKDVGIAADLADQIGAQAPVVRLIRDLWNDARDGVGGGEDHTRAATYWERRPLQSAAE